MARTLLAVPIGSRVGLTSACLGLLRALDRRGVRVGYVKPLAQPSADEESDRSADLVRALTTLRPPEPLAVATVEELLGTGALDTVLEEVVGRWRPVRDEHDVVVVEGLNPGPTHIYSGQANQAMARALDADVLLVGSWPAAVHQSVEAEAEHLAEGLAIAARSYSIGEDLRVIGCVVNRLPDEEVREAVRAALARRGRPLVAGSLYRADLTAPRVRDLVDELGLRVLAAGDLDRRITDIAVFAQAIPGGLRVLTEGRLVVVPGDRHEVVMAACLTALNGVPLAALLLTAGIAPDPQVWELTRAALATGLPVLVSDSGTYESAVAVRELDVDLGPADLSRAEAVMAHGADAYADDWLTELVAERSATRLSPAAFRYQLTEMARAASARIVLPEGTEPRTVRAAAICAERGIARPVLLGAPDEVRAVARSLGVALPETVEIIDPDEVAENYVDDLFALRRAKGWTEEMARERLGDAIMVGTMMLQRGEVAGLVSGAEHTTADTVRPALQVIGTRPGASLVSSVFFMCLPDQVLVYGDCAINPQPTAPELADIAIQSAESARAFGIEPRVAMISFSTGESGAGSDVLKVAEATALVRERAPGLAVDGPMQYDAAASASVGRSKRPGSEVAGRATVFIFPDLDTGNTTYKAVQRSADVISVGPLLQGLAKPVNDLSRGALVDDIVYTIALTAIQSATG